MKSLNICHLIGNVGKDPETRVTNGGLSITNWTLATSEKRKDEEQTTWHNIVAFGKLAEIAQQYVAKGNPVYVSGRIQTRKWQDKEGKDRWTTEIVADNLILLGGSKAAASKPSRHEEEKRNGYAPEPELNDEIPFN